MNKIRDIFYLEKDLQQLYVITRNISMHRQLNYQPSFPTNKPHQRRLNTKIIRAFSVSNGRFMSEWVPLFYIIDISNTICNKMTYKHKRTHRHIYALIKGQMLCESTPKKVQKLELIWINMLSRIM